MREKTVKPQDRVTISTKNMEPAEAFDLSAIESIPHEKIKEYYRQAVEENTEAVLKLVTLRLAMDSVVQNVERALTGVMNGSPIEIVNEKTTERIDDAFDKALLVLCVEKAMSVVTNDVELKTNFIQKYMDMPRVMAPIPKADDGTHPIGIVTPRSQEALVERDIDFLKDRVNRKLRNKDDSESPYGNNKPIEPDSKVKGKRARLPVAGTIKRASIRSKR